MYKILVKEDLGPKIKLFELEAPLLAAKAKPGQFVIIRIDEKGERFPLTIAGADAKKGTVKVVFNEVGKSTIQLGQLNQGESILNLVGPLGKESEIKNYGTVLCFGGGVLIPSLWYLVTELKKAGNKIIGVAGARTKELLVYKKELEDISDEFHITTDDGSEGNQGLEFLQEILDREKVDRVWVMSTAEATMKAVSEVTRPYEIKTIVSLAPIMVDGTGMCGCCRVTIDEGTEFACVDGPEFNGHQVDWDELMSRKRNYLPEERISSMLYERTCCKEK
jgi:ferredoxin--NADP+ reductase